MIAPRPIHPGLRRGGFTLLEILVAMLMASILALSVVSTLLIAFRAREHAEAAVAPYRSAEVAMDIIQKDLESAQAPIGLLTQQTNFEGVLNGAGGRGDFSAQLQFASNGDAPQHVDGNGDIKQLTLLVEQQGNDQVLVRQVVSNLLSPQQMTPDEEVICRHVVTFNLRYFDGEEWQTAWDSTQYNNVLPTAVEVTIEARPPGAAANATVYQRRIIPLSCVTVANYGSNNVAGAAATTVTPSGTGSKSNTTGAGK